MRRSITTLLSGALLVLGTTAGAAPPGVPFAGSGSFPLNTNRIGFADSDILVMTSAPDTGVLPEIVSLGVPMPNPFNPSVTIPYSVGRRGVVQLGVFDLRGRHVCTLVSDMRAEGLHMQAWDGRDDEGTIMPAGIYLVRVRLDDAVATRKISLVK